MLRQGQNQVKKTKNEPTFEVFEQENEFDDQAVDQQKEKNDYDPYMTENAAKLIELRNKKLHEKAQNLLGRSFRNAVIHSQIGDGSGLASNRKKESDKISKDEESKDKPVLGGIASKKNLMGSQYQHSQQPPAQPEFKPSANFKKKASVFAAKMINQSSDMQDASDDMSPKNNQQLPDDQVNKVIGPRKGEEKIPEVFSEGIDILDGEFDYDISILNVEEYSLLQGDLKISNL